MINPKATLILTAGLSAGAVALYLTTRKKEAPAEPETPIRSTSPRIATEASQAAFPAPQAAQTYCPPPPKCPPPATCPPCPICAKAAAPKPFFPSSIAMPKAPSGRVIPPGPTINEIR